MQGPSLGYRLILLMLLSVTLMTLDHRTSYVNSIRSSIAVLVYPVQYLVNFPGNVGDWASDSLTSRKTLQEDNATLRTQNLILTTQLQKLNFIESENIQLRNLLESSKRVGERILIAELLSVDMDPYKQQVTINKGSASGDDIYPGQPFVDAKGVMGKLMHVAPFSSTALLITDPDHTLPVQVNRNGLRAIAKGTGSQTRLDIPHLPNNADIKIGDLLVTSGLGCVFPVGYPAATIVEINIDPSLPFAQVLAEPIAELDRSREILLVWPGGKAKPNPANPCQLESDLKPDNTMPSKTIQPAHPAKEKPTS
ncbi:MAG: rod shape-determining protein MreC [Gammaproteobacteria bacterium]|nr:rod shape-determining protein MreC [Gammaproteobacteria bacterium]MCW9031092.1 rod shape-determining protein MreC [Gammaproteobacteria bacterium]